MQKYVFVNRADKSDMVDKLNEYASEGYVYVTHILFPDTSQYNPAALIILDDKKTQNTNDQY